ncbi:MAG: sugar-binding domain-containing protein [Phycisphaerae bacterium]
MFKSTIWVILTVCLTAAAQAPVPLAEHPRPQLRRDVWMNLNGTWQFQFDPNQQGQQSGWQKSDAAEFGSRIVVPFAWQSKASGLAKADARGAGWYRRTFELPAGWKDDPRRLWLRIERADHELTAWVNGQLVGSHAGGYSPMAFDISEAVDRKGPNVLTIRVVDHQRLDQPTGDQTLYTPVSGICGTVWLELAPATRILSVGGGRVQIASGDRNVTYELSATGEAIDSDKIESWPRFTSGRTRKAQVKLALPLKQEFQSDGWRPGAPKLVDIRLTLRPVEGDGPADVVDTYIAPGGRPRARPINNRLREIFHVGDKPVWLAGAGYTARWPETLTTPPSDEAIIRDMQIAKSMGLNLLRLKGTIPTHRMVYHADRLGVVLMVDLPSARSIEFVDRQDASEDWGGGIMGVSEKWFWTLPWDRMCLEFIRNYAAAPSIWFVTESQSRLDIGDAGYHEKLLHWLHWRWHDLYSWGQFLAVEWHGNSGRCIQPDWWDLTLNTQRPAAARASLKAQLARNRYRVFEEETVNNTDQRAETILVSEFGRADWWTRDTEIASHLVELAGVVRSTPDSLAGMIWCDLTDTEFEKYGLVEYDRAAKVFDLDRLLKGWQVRDLFAPVSLSLDGPLLRTVRGGSKLGLGGTLFIGHADPVAQPIRLQWQFSFRDSLGQLRQLPEKELTFAVASRLNRFAPLSFASPAIDVPDQKGMLIVSVTEPASGAKAAAVLEVDAPAAMPRPDQLALQWLPGDYVDAAGEWIGSTARTGQQKLAIEGRGEVTYRFSLPANLPDGAPVGGRVVFEAGSCAGDGKVDIRMPGYQWSGKWNLLHQEDYRVALSGDELTHQRLAKGYPQTDASAWPSQWKLTLAGQPVGWGRLDNDWAGAAGALSNRVGIDEGSYGQLVEVPLKADLLAKVWKAIRDNSGQVELKLAFSGLKDHQPSGGLNLYGDRMGAHAVPMTLLLNWDKPADGLGRAVRVIPDHAHWQRENPYVTKWQGLIADRELAKAWQADGFQSIQAQPTVFASSRGRTVQPPPHRLMLVDLTRPGSAVQGQPEAILKSYIHLPEGRKVAFWTGGTHPWKLTVVRPDGRELKPIGLYHKWIGVMPEARMGVYDLPAGTSEIRIWTRRTWPTPWQVSLKVTDQQGQTMKDVKLSDEKPHRPNAGE